MAMGKEIVIKFDSFGGTHLDAVGFKGTSCKAATAAYLSALNPSAKDDKNKPEYSQPSNVGAKLTTNW